jgi:IS30 family transposase
MERDNCIADSRKGKHLKWEERVVIERMLGAGYPAPKIAMALSRHRRTIERELKRGQVEHKDTEWRVKTVYSSERAQDLHDLNATAKGPHLKLGANHTLVAFVYDRIIAHKESPAVVAYRMRHEGMIDALCAKTLYNYIDQGLIAGVSNESLWEKRKRRQHPKRSIFRSRRAIPKGESIQNRPAQIESREQFGHWEIDLITGPARSKAALLTLVERQTRRLIVRKLPDKTQIAVLRALNGIERGYGPAAFQRLFKSITADNGSEFLDVASLQTSAFSNHARTRLFYTHPYSAWERGTNENTNRIIRRFVAKGHKIETINQQSVRTIEHWINNYPRQILDFRSPQQCFDTQMTHTAA